MTRTTDGDDAVVDSAPSVITAGARGPIAEAEPHVLVHEPQTPGTSAKLAGGPAYRKYLGLYALGSLGITPSCAQLRPWLIGQDDYVGAHDVRIAAGTASMVNVF